MQQPDRPEYPAAELMRVLEEQRIGLHPENGDIRVVAPAGTLTESLRSAIRANKTHLLKLLAQRNRKSVRETDGIPRANRGEPLVASFAQKSLWVLHELNPGLAAYNISGALRLRGPMDAALIARTLGEIVRRHEALRTTFAAHGGEPVQVVDAPGEVDFREFDLSELPPETRMTTLHQQLDAEAQRPFDLARGPLFRPRLWKLGPADHVLQFNVHHIVFDGWSYQLLLSEFARICAADGSAAKAGLPEPALQFVDCAAWQNRRIADDRCLADLDFWRRLLQGAPGLLELPTDRPRPARFTHAGQRRTRVLSGPLVEALNALQRTERTTMFMVLFAAFHVLLHRYSRQTDIVVGTPVANRPREAFESVMGFFVNTLPIRVRIDESARFREFLRAVHHATLDALAHQEVPFDRIVEAINPSRSASHSPVFQVLFTHQKPQSDLTPFGVETEFLRIESRSAKYDLSFYVSEESRQITITADFCTDLFDPSTIERWLANYEQVLLGITTDPERSVASLPLLTDVERRLVVETWNNTGTNAPRNECVSQLFEAQTTRTPWKVALVAGDEKLSFAQLNARANQLAHYLRRLGVAPDGLVGVCLERTADLIVALLAVHKAGGAYVPLDPAYPRARLAHIIADASPPVLLTQDSLAHLWSSAEIPSAVRPRIVSVDSIRSGIARESTENFISPARPENLSHVIYTSGSTGRPHGVAIEHRNVTAFLRWARDTFSDDELSGVLASTSVCFDLSVFEIFVPLSWGGTIHLAENVLALPTLATAMQITLINTVPSAIAALLRGPGIPSSVRVVNLAGEPLPGEIVDRLYARPHVRKVHDLYGPTEDTVYSTFALRAAGAPATIGRPLANRRLYLLDAHRQPVPIGVPGEIYLGGAGVARGYLNQPDLTAQRFVPDPFSPAPGARLYRTGDLARFRPDGNVEFLGRIDHQVKVRGFRIELGEIEAVLRTHPSVRDAVVIAREVAPGDKRLAGYVVLNAEVSDAPGVLREFLRTRLPEYMVPSAIVILEHLPMTPNGKVDRKALPTPDDASLADKSAFAAPRDETERHLVELWCGILRKQRVGIHDNFFDLGGHSLLAMQLVSRLRTDLGIEIPLRQVFEGPTVAELAATITNARAGSNRGEAGGDHPSREEGLI